MTLHDVEGTAQPISFAIHIEDVQWDVFAGARVLQFRNSWLPGASCGRWAPVVFFGMLVTTFV